MPKGRIFAPPTDYDGIWFRHRSLRGDTGTLNSLDTSTGQMLSSPYTHPNYPPSPPEPYYFKDKKNFKHSNDFSDHDNRNSFQDHGVYFGDGRETRHLGKRLREGYSRQHFTDKDYLKHHSRIITNYEYNTIYESGFKERPTSEPPTKRRFPRFLPEVKDGSVELTTSTCTWHHDSAPVQRIPIKVLANSQVPYLSHNTWKYSYHGLMDRPPYNLRSTRKDQICE